jgi:hypothetical protein
MLRKIFFILGVLCLNALLLPETLWAQTQATTGQIAGRVLDASGATLAGASVKAKSADTGFEQSATANEDGNFKLVQLPPGKYVITAEASGFSEVMTEVDVFVGRAVNVDLTLGAAGANEVVNVIPSAVAIQTTRSEADSVQNDVAIRNLPINGRRFQDFVTLSPNAQVEPRRGQISLAGQRGIYGANVNVDGADFNQSFFGGIRGGERSNSAFTVPQESIREFQVISSGYSAEFGRSTGGIVNAVTKSGTNEYHGTGFYLVRPEEASRSNDFFRTVEQNLRTQAMRSAAQMTNTEVIPAPTQQQFGGSFGGPIQKDKFFFFASYEQQRLRQTRQTFFPNLTNQIAVNDQTREGFNFYSPLQGDFQQTNDVFAGLVKLDYKVNNANFLSVRYNHSFNRALNANSTGNALFPTTISDISNNGPERNRNNIGVVQLNSTLSPSLLNEFRFQYAREDRPRGSNSSTPNFNTFIGNTGAVNFLPTTQFDTRTQFVDNITYLRGNHTFKFGFDYSRVFANQLFGFNQFGAYTFNGVNDAAQVLRNISIPQNANGNPLPFPTGQFGRFDQTTARYNQQIGDRFGEFTVHQIAFYGQDSWKIRQNLTLNYGLRYEAQLNPEPDADNAALVNAVSNTQFPINAPGFRNDPTNIPNSVKQFAPRLGVAYDPFNNGKSVFRANVGLYYAATPLLLFAASQNNFRSTPGDVSVQLPFTIPAPFVNGRLNPAYTAFANNFNANAATAAYRTAFGNLNPNPATPTTPLLNLPNTVYRQLFLAGVNLNNFSLNNLPTVNATQLRSVADTLGSPFLGAVQPTFTADDFRNPRSLQYNIGYEYEVARGLTLGIDYSQVNTAFLQRNRDINLSAPVPDAFGRPIFGARPSSEVGQLTVRESTARSTYRAMVLRAKFERKFGQFSAFYTLSDNKSSDDNERDAGGFTYDNSFNLAPEFGFSNIDRRHQFVVNPVFFLPLGFEVASTMRFQSGFPIDARVGSDVNRDNSNTDRPLSAIGVPFQRNAFRNRAQYNVDLRVQKTIKITEGQRVSISAEFFNLFNAMNLQLAGGAVTNFCAATNLSNCGINAALNPNFLQLRDQIQTSPTFGQLLTNNTPGSPFQFQFGVRYQF